MSASIIPDPIAAELRRRAAVLRRFATRLDSAAVNELVRRAGSDTWIGPAADDCCADLQLQRTVMTGSATDLRAVARALEQRAAAIPTGTTTPIGGPR